MKWRARFVRLGVDMERVRRAVRNRVWKYATRMGISPDEMWDHVQEWGFSDFVSVDDAIDGYAAQGDVAARMLKRQADGNGTVREAVEEFGEERADATRSRKMDIKRAGHGYVFRLSPNEEGRFHELVRQAKLNRSEYIRRAIFGQRPRIWDPAKLTVDWWTPDMEDQYDRPTGRAPSDRSP